MNAATCSLATSNVKHVNFKSLRPFTFDDGSFLDSLIEGRDRLSADGLADLHEYTEGMSDEGRFLTEFMAGCDRQKLLTSMIDRIKAEAVADEATSVREAFKKIAIEEVSKEMVAHARRSGMVPLTRKLDISPSALSPTAGEVFFKQDIAVYTTVSFAAEMGVAVITIAAAVALAILVLAETSPQSEPIPEDASAMNALPITPYELRIIARQLYSQITAVTAVEVA